MTEGVEREPLRAQIVENQRTIDALNERLARKTQEVRVIQQISSEINSTIDLEQVLHIILGAMADVLGFAHSMILLLHPTEPKLQVVASRGFAHTGVGAEVPVGRGIIGMVAKRRRIVRMGNIRSQMAYTTSVRQQMEASGVLEKSTEVTALPGLPDVDSQIGIPLLIKDRLVGVFSVESPLPNAFDELDEVLLMILANQAASVIDNARLYQAERERLAELNAAYARLTELNESLEGRVADRTAALATALEEVESAKQRSMELLERMAPCEVIPLLLEDKLLARRLTATILFTDLEGFTQYSSSLEPDEVFSQLNHFFSHAGEQIGTFRGYVNKTNGDSIMALFGVPNQSLTHAIDAVLAGLRVQGDLDRHQSMSMRVGINTGVLTAGMLGPENKQLYDVLGDAVNVASRMEKVCRPGAVTITESTYKLVEPYFEVTPLGENEVKGKGAILAYEVVGIRPLRRDLRRVDPASLFAQRYLELIDEVEQIKAAELDMVDFVSIQGRDGALLHNEAAATFALALLRHLRSAVLAGSGSHPHRIELEAIQERDLVHFLLLHDLGKYRVDAARLTDPNLSKDDRSALIAELFRKTHRALEQLERVDLIEKYQRFHTFQAARGAVTHADAFTLIAAVADMYDALTAPKVYKGKPWSIQGALEEIMRMPYALHADCPVVRSFAELMRPQDKQLKASAKVTKVFR